MLMDILVYDHVFRDTLAVIVIVNLLVLMHPRLVSVSQHLVAASILGSLRILFSVVSSMALIDPTCGQAFRAHCSLPFLDYHQSLRLFALLLDVLAKSVLFHDNI